MPEAKTQRGGLFQGKAKYCGSPYLVTVTIARPPTAAAVPAGSMGLGSGNQQRSHQRQRNGRSYTDLLHHVATRHTRRDQRNEGGRLKQAILRKALQSKLDHFLIGWLTECLCELRGDLCNGCLAIAVLPNKGCFLIEAKCLITLLIIDHQLSAQLFNDELITL